MLPSSPTAPVFFAAPVAVAVPVFDPRPILGYWSIRGLANPIRLLLSHLGVQYVDERFELTPDGDRSSWLSVKETKGLDFPNLPYWIEPESGIRITQSAAILRHIAEKYDLAGITREERAIVTMLEGTIADFRGSLVRLVYGPDYHTNLEAFLEKTAGPFLDRINKFLEKNGGGFLLGDTATLPDFMLWEMCDELRGIKPGFTAPYFFVNRFCSLFEALPGVFQFFATNNNSSLPFNGPSASFK